MIDVRASSFFFSYLDAQVAIDDVESYEEADYYERFVAHHESIRFEIIRQNGIFPINQNFQIIR